jgi:hypothetical protein
MHVDRPTIASISPARPRARFPTGGTLTGFDPVNPARVLSSSVIFDCAWDWAWVYLLGHATAVLLAVLLALGLYGPGTHYTSGRQPRAGRAGGWLWRRCHACSKLLPNNPGRNHNGPIMALLPAAARRRGAAGEPDQRRAPAGPRRRSCGQQGCVRLAGAVSRGKWSRLPCWLNEPRRQRQVEWSG